jgi:hypothetical protein
MTRVISLDALLPDDVVFEVAGRQYTLPGDPPLNLLLTIRRGGGLQADSKRTDQQEASDHLHMPTAGPGQPACWTGEYTE